MNVLTEELLKQVELQERNKEEVEKDKFRLRFHLMPPVGWLNDPNGLCYWKGWYHVFFQYAPFHAEGGLKLWGHYRSQNLLEWEYVGAAVLPDSPFDCHGVYSGSALAEKETLYLFYTGNVKHEGEFDYINTGREGNVIMVQSQDGIHFSNKKCILQNKDYPISYTCHIRDPKVWKEKQQFYMVLGGRKKEEKGAVLLYCSKDLTHWEFKKEITTKEPFGYMWECPDFFQIEDNWVLSISPQGLQRESYCYQNVYQSGYFLCDKEIEKLEEDSLTNFEEWDYGFDFYAPQTFLDERGRRILIGWIGVPDSEKEYTNPTISSGWQHALTVPRQITKVDQKLYTYPVEEISQLREQQIEVKTGKELTIAGGIFDLELQNESDSFCITIAEGLTLQYTDHTCFLSFSNEIGSGRTLRRAFLKTCKQVRILVDYSVVEIYFNRGEKVFTTRFYPKMNVISLKVEGENINGFLWTLRKKNDTIKE